MIPRRHFLVSFALILVTAASARADDIDDFIKSEMQQRRIPAVALAVVKNGSVIKVEGYGLADMENGIAARPDTVFKIGSVSKQFIATGIMLLVQDGRMALNDKIPRYLAASHVLVELNRGSIRRRAHASACADPCSPIERTLQRARTRAAP